MKWKYSNTGGREQPWLGSVVENLVVDSQIVDNVTRTIWRSENVKS